MGSDGYEREYSKSTLFLNFHSAGCFGLLVQISLGATMGSAKGEWGRDLVYSKQHSVQFIGGANQTGVWSAEYMVALDLFPGAQPPSPPRLAATVATPLGTEHTSMHPRLAAAQPLFVQTHLSFHLGQVDARDGGGDRGEKSE